MNIGILINNSKIQQGAYQFSLTASNVIVKNSRHNYFILTSEMDSLTYESTNVSIKILSAIEGPCVRMLRYIATILDIPFHYGRYGCLKDFNLDLIIALPTASWIGQYLKVPYVVFIADMMFEYFPWLPEFSVWERLRRHYSYRKAARGAVLCVVDSECGKEHVAKHLGLQLDRIRAIPFIPPPYVYQYKDKDTLWAKKILVSYDLPKDFLFYPAQFWHHKNHCRLINALYMLKEKYRTEIPVVLVGSDKGNYNEVLALVKKLKLESSIKILGYVSNVEIVALYKMCKALVYPSLFGPTNIPIVEAIVLGVPVICSRLFGMPDQVGDAGILFDPFNIKDMADRIYQVWINEVLQETLVFNSRKKAKILTPEAYCEKWAKVVNEALDIVGT